MSNRMSALRVFNDPVGEIPEDITLLTPDDLRNAHAYWTASHNYSSSRLADVQAKLKEIKRKREVTFKLRYLKNKNTTMTNEEARYNAEMSKKVRKIDDKIAELEGMEIRWENLLTQCEQLKFLCSRDQSFRETEIQTYYGRGGQGR